MGKFKGKIPEKLISVFFLGLIFVYLSVIIFKNPDKFGVGDWDIKYAKAFCNIESITKYHQFPLWNPYHCGGISQIGDGTNDYLTPLFGFNLFFGPNIGYRVIFLIYLIVGLISFYKLGRYFKLSFIGSLFSSIVYMFSGLFFQVFASGMPEFLSLTLLPLFLLYYLEALDTQSLKPVIKSSIVLMVIFFSGHNYLPFTLIFILFLTASRMIVDKNINAGKILITFLFIFLPLSSIKTIPVIEQTIRYPRYILERNSGYSLRSLGYALFSRDQTESGFSNWGNHETDSFINGLSYAIDENGIYIGIIVFFLFFLGLLRKNKYKTLMLIILIIFIYLSFGLYINPSLYKLIHSFPILDNLRVAQRYRFFFMIPIAFFSGLGLDKLQFKKIISWGILLLVTLDLITVNSKILKETFILPAVELKKTAGFIQSSGKISNLSLSYSSNSAEYPFLLAGYGVVGCYEARRIRPKNIYIETKNYQGEYYLVNKSGKVVNTYWSPNKLKFQVNIKERDRLVVNQMFDKGWRVKSQDKRIRLEVINHKELIGLNLKPGNYQISLYYLPTSFIIGAIITSLSIIVIMAFFVYGNKYE